MSEIHWFEKRWIVEKALVECWTLRRMTEFFQIKKYTIRKIVQEQTGRPFRYAKIDYNRRLSEREFNRLHAERK